VREIERERERDSSREHETKLISKTRDTHKADERKML
jgi:hypothetical protein